MQKLLPAVSTAGKVLAQIDDPRNYARLEYVLGSGCAQMCG
jgi:hypothetical protein